jgi:hypothetical protein
MGMIAVPAARTGESAGALPDPEHLHDEEGVSEDGG